MVSDRFIAVVIVVPFALAIGSFMTVVIDRVPSGGSVVRPRSRCPSCGTEILTRDNIPLVGWLVLRGRCRACGSPISIVYPLTELATAALMVAAVAVQDSVWIGVGFAALLALMPAIAVIDIRHRIIPNRIVYPALVAFPVYFTIARFAGAPVDLGRMVVGFLGYGGLLLIVSLVSGGMGMGDVKLAALIGLVLGTTGLGAVAVAAGAGVLLGGIGAVVALALGASRKTAIPYGPYLAAGAVVGALAAEPIVTAYLDLLR